MFNIYFLSLVATYKTPQPRFFSILFTQHTPSIRWIGLLLALLLHIAGLMLLLDAQPESVPLSLPQPIRVSLISESTKNTQSSPATKQAEEKPAPTKPKAETKPIEKPKPQAQIKPAKPKPVLAAQSQTAEPMTSPNTQALAKLPKPSPNTMPAPSSSSYQSDATATSTGNHSAQVPLTLPNLNAGYLHNPEPHYPSESRQEGEEGKVLLRVFVSAEGHAEQVVLKKSSGFARLDNAALSTVQQWRFVPAHRGAEAVSAWVVVPISFSLDE